MDSNALALKSLEKLLLAQGFLYCPISGQKITSPEDLALLCLGLKADQILTLPVHKAHSKELLQTQLSTFSKWLPTLDDPEDNETI